MLKGIVKLFGGNAHKRTMESLFPLVDEINALEGEYEALSDEALRAKTQEFRAELATGDAGLPPLGGTEGGSESQEVLEAVLDDLLPHTFAAVREASKRAIGLRPYDVQLIGGAVLHRGQIAEMRTGEGKTLVATLPIYLNALTGRGVHLVTVNDYLARRDARWMGKIFHLLGLSVGVLQMAAVTENGKKAFIVDYERESPNEESRHLRMVDRVEAYAADVTYGTNSEFGFDYLRDNMAMRMQDRVQRGHAYAIVDEVDNVLIDEARTPLIISGPASGDLEWYGKMAGLVRQLQDEDYEINEKDRSISLTEIGVARVERILGYPLQDLERPEDVTPEQARLLGFLEQSLRAQHLFKRNKDYLVQAGKVIIVDENTGRMMPGRRWSDGLHQAIEAKEGVRVEPESVTYATVTLQNYFRMYEKLAGMTGTALTEAEEFSKIYNLEVTPIITNLEYQSAREDAQLVEVKSKDEEGYPVIYFADREPSPVIGRGQGEGGGSVPRYWRRKDYPDVVYRTFEAKARAILQEMIRLHVLGRPLLIGTTSVENSESLSERLRAEPIRRLMQILLIRSRWFEKNNREEDGRLDTELLPLYVPLEELDAGELRANAKKLGVSESLSFDDPLNLSALLRILNLKEGDAPRLKSVLQAGIQHKVLNARKHAEESKIIAGAGAFGAVTIATSMAGRGVDIKLGGEIDEAFLAEAKDIIKGIGVEDPYGMTNAEILEAFLVQVLRKEDLGLTPNGNRLEFFSAARRALITKYGQAGPDDWSQLSNVLYARLGLGLKASETLGEFWRHTEQEMQVRALGGLAVLATERHEARRIDNQLRGRAARQGDPGSSRFYLSLQDELMRIQGGERVSNMMERLHVDDAFPLEVGVVGRVIEQSQHRVEGANFDVRKHLLEYDDVLNNQRKQIYSQRDRVFAKDDLQTDIHELLEAEVRSRVETAFEDEEGGWRLLAWLEQVQPPFMIGADKFFANFTIRTVEPELEDATDLKAGVVEVVRRAIEAEQEHLDRAIDVIIERATEALEKQIAEREDILDMFFQGLGDADEVRKPQQILEELQSILRVNVKLNNDQMRQLIADPEKIGTDIRAAVKAQLTDAALSRLIGSLETRIGDSLGLSKDALLRMDWDAALDTIDEAAESTLERGRERLVGAGGQIARDVEMLIQREKIIDESTRARLLLSVSQGMRATFDPRTKREVKQAYARFSYAFLAAQILKEHTLEEVIEAVLVHLEEAEDALTLAWGGEEVSRLANPNEARDEAEIREVGRRTLNESQRRLLLSAITELWVDYLTRVEALRISIGLEAYAQRDPLVQYKTRASEMFQELLKDIRATVIGRVFSFQRRPNVEALEDAPVDSVAPKAAVQAEGGKKKRKRH